MKILPITPAYKPSNPPQRPRALMIVRHNDHEVVDTATGNRFKLPAGEAWALHQSLNMKA